jgi:hypothetical protein
MIGWCVACLRLNRTEASGDLIRWFEESVPIARDLIAESLPFVTDSSGSQDNLRNLLAAFAACHGNAPLGLLLFELDAGGFRCDNCREFIQPMESSMNAFWVEGKSTGASVASNSRTTTCPGTASMTETVGVAEAWDEGARGPLTVRAVRGQHQPTEHFRISLSAHASGDAFTGTSRAGRVYVIYGRCEYHIGDQRWVLSAPCFVDLPAGDFRFSVPGDCDVMQVRVWELPPEVWPKSDSDP